MEPSRQRLSDLLHGTALPPPPARRALILGTIAAIVAAVAGGMASYTHDLRVAPLALGIGVLVGLAIVRARGYGTRLMITASALTIVSIAGAYYLNFRLVTMLCCTEKAHADLAQQSAAWKALDNPTDEQVSAFARQWNLDYGTREAFARYPGTMLDWFADNQPTLGEWRSWEADNRFFLDHLQATVGATDVALGLVAVLIAAGLIYLRTSKLEHRAKQRAIAGRQS